MHDIINVIKNLQTLSENNQSFETLKNFERVIDELDIYVYKNWQEGELIAGPNVSRYMVECTFMWPEEEMPDPEGGRRLVEYGCNVKYRREKILVPRKIRDADDYRPGTKKGKIDAHPIWTVTVEMPKKLMQDVKIGKENQDNNRMAELMRYSKQAPLSPEETAQESPDEEAQA